MNAPSIRAGSRQPLRVVSDGVVTPLNTEVSHKNEDLESVDLQLTLARASDSTFWAAHAQSYTIDLISANSGRVLRRLVRQPPWFKIHPRNTPEGILNPRITQLDVDSKGRLWVHSLVAAPGWEDMYVEVKPRSARAAFIAAKPGYKSSQMRASIIEVIDPSTATVIVSSRYGWTMGGFISAGKIYTHEDDDLGRTKLHIWRVSLLSTRNQ